MRFYQSMGCVAAFLIAAWTFVITLLVGTFGLVPVSYTVVLGHAVVLGLPLFLIFWWKRWVNVVTCIGGGFLVAAASGIIPNWPVDPKGGSAWNRGGALVINGVPTLAGWLEFLQVLIFLGVFGAIAGLVFWSILLSTHALAPGDTGADRSGQRSAIALGLATILITATLVALPSNIAGRLVELALVRHQTCHNVLRNRDSISPLLRIDLQLANEEASKFARTMEDFAATHKLQFLDSTSALIPQTMSLCNDRLTIQASVNGIAVFETQADSGWQQMTKHLADRVESLWPGTLRFRSPAGGNMPRPKELL